MERPVAEALRPPGSGIPPVELILGHLRDASLAMGLAFLCAVIGVRFLKWSGGPGSAERPVDLIVGFCIGWGAVAISILIAGLTVGVSPGILGALIVGWIVVAAGATLSTVRRTRSAASAFVEATEPWSLALLGLVAAFLVIQAATPVTDWDSLMYHLEVPRRFLEEGRIHVPVDNLHVAFIGLPHMLYLPLLAFGSAAAIQFLNAGTAMLLGLVVLSLSRRLFGPGSGSIAAPLLFACTMVPLVAITARVDVLLALFLLVGHASLIEFLARPRFRTAIVSGTVLGLAVGVKYTALAYVGLLVPVAVVALWWGREGWSDRAVLRAAAGGAIAFLVAAAPWILKNGILLDAPLYPFLAEIRPPSWLASLYAESGAELPGERIYQALGNVRAPLDLPSLFLAPGRLTVEGEGSYYYLNPLFLLLPLALLDPRRRRMAAIALPALLYVLFVALVRPTTNLRYLMPALAPLTIAVAAVIGARTGRELAIVLTVLAMVPTGIAAHRWMTARDALGHLIGSTSAEEYLRSHPDPGVTTYVDLVDRMDEIARPGERILLLFEARGFGFEAETLQDNLLVNWPLLDPLIGDTCRVAGQPPPFDYVVLNMGVLNYYRSRGLDPDLLGLERFARYARECLEVRYRNPGFFVFAPRP